MKKYRRPDLISYRSRDIIETVGPCQAQSAFVDVGGGIQAMLDTERTEYRQQSMPIGIKLVQMEIKNNTTA